MTGDQVQSPRGILVGLGKEGNEVAKHKCPTSIQLCCINSNLATKFTPSYRISEVFVKQAD